MIFTSPVYLWGILAVPLLLAVGMWAIAGRRRRAALFSSRIPSSSRRDRLLLAGEAAACGLLAVALAGPESRDFSGEIETDSVDIIDSIDIMLVLDLSSSMLAEDVAPSRLARARREAGSLLGREGGEGARFGLVVYAGTARLVCALTEDRETLRALLENCDGRDLERGGSHLAAGLRLACGSFDRDGRLPRAVIVLTDGEERGDSSELEAAVDFARVGGVPVFFLLVGTPGGARIPLLSGGFLRDRSGREVLTSSRSDPADSIARATGGVCLSTAQSTFTMDALHAELINRVTGGARLLPAGADRSLFQWFLLAAVGLLAALFFVPVRAGRHAGAGLFFLVLCLGPSGCGGETALDTARAGNRFYDRGDFERAAVAFERSLSISRNDGDSSELRGDVTFNLGLTYYRMGKIDGALSRLGEGVFSGDREREARLRFVRGLCFFRLAEEGFFRLAEEASRPGGLDVAALEEAGNRAREAARLFGGSADASFFAEEAGHNATRARALAAGIEKKLDAIRAGADKNEGEKGDRSGGGAGTAPTAGGEEGGDSAAGEASGVGPSSALWRDGAAGRWAEDPGDLSPEEIQRIFSRLGELKRARSDRETRRAAERLKREVDW